MLFSINDNFFKKTLLKIVLLTLFFITLNSRCFSQSVTQNYIEEHKDFSVDLMNKYHLPASIILGVAIHESGSGTSKIARYLNNHFGIKGYNNSTQIRSAYKGFEVAEDSYLNFIDILQSRSKFKILFNKYSDYDYRSWAYGIQRGGYAASRTWASQVIAIIKKYKLYELDNRPIDYVEPVEAVKVNIYYKVKPGDTLGKIALKYHTTVKNLMKRNNLKSPILQIGQKLRIK
ncbi:glucosaminidase domain-containing protein [Pedobacter sp. SD-b]|uniref:Peptidoglycan hydrolase n=1 Tax=Pedobacter segetis TaxID=2793069 RepID=A0ABS1BJQ1_9SPHI|nr:glucosaminidase domain-containing protein [Pedobacter segetis]MBK0383114.1 glucosaminidase domain-containing protein [Pedobacter segetis]